MNITKTFSFSRPFTTKATIFLPASHLDSTRWIAVSRRASARRNVALLTASTLWLPALLNSAPVAAQVPRAATTATTPPVAPVANPAAANGVNVLIVAFDDLSLSLSSNPLRNRNSSVPPTAASNTITPAPPAAPLPAPAIAAPAQAPARSQMAPRPEIVPSPETSPRPAIKSAITPAAILLPNALAQWRALAKKAPKVPIDEDDRFRMEPETMKTYPAPDKNNAPANGNAVGTSNGTAANGTAANGTFSGTQAGDYGAGIVSSSPFALGSGSAAGGSGPTFSAGEAQQAAAPLRRALVGNGFTDVLNAAPNSSTIERAINSSRLAPRVIETLRVELAKLATATTAPQDESADKISDTTYRMAYRAAARIGQAVGYRAVVVLGVVPQNDKKQAGETASFVMMVVDAAREEGDQLVFQENAPDKLKLNQSAALTANAYITRQTTNWPALTERDKLARANDYMMQARLAAQAGELDEAQDTINQVLAFDPNRAEARLLLADVLRSSDPTTSARVISNVLEAGGGDGPTWAKAAIAYTLGEAPDWPAALKAANKALALKYESSALYQAMATAELGRASLFRDADRVESAEKAEADAEKYLNRALEMAPGDPAVTRLMMRQLVQSGRYKQALLALDRMAVQYPDDAELQGQYAIALLKVGRDEDAFAAWARVIALSGEAPMAPDTFTYRHLAEGFDQREANIGKRAGQLAASVAANNTAQGAALVQMNRYAEDAEQASVAIKALAPTLDGRGGVLHASRVAAADLIVQAVANHQTYLETGQGLYRDRANELHRNAIVVINSARTGR